MVYTWFMPFNQQAIIAALQKNHLFEKLPTAVLAALVEQVEVVQLQKHQVIYRQGSPANCIYIILSGKVHVNQQSNKKPPQTAELIPGDYLGIGAARRRRRIGRAVASEETTLLRLDKDRLSVLLRRVPQLKPYFKVAIQTHQTVQKAPLSFLRPDEGVYFMARKHWFFLAVKIAIPATLAMISVLAMGLISFSLPAESLVPFLLSGLGFGVASIWFVWNFLDWHNDYFIMTSQRVIWLEKVAIFYDSRQEAPLSTILSLGVKTSQIGRLVGYGDVVIRTYTGTVVFNRVARPEYVSAQIEEHWSRAKETNNQEESQAIEKAIRQRLGFEKSPAGGGLSTEQVVNTPVPSVFQPGIIPLWLSHLLHMRFEQGQVITYRKHWFVLVERTWKPLLLLTLVSLAQLARILGLITVFSMGIALLIGFILLMGLLVWLLYEYLDWHNDIFQLTFDQIIDIDRKPLGHEERKSAPLENVLSIQYERRGLMGLLLNFGTVTIAVGSSKLTFDYVYNPSQVQQDIFNRMAQFNAHRKKEEVDAERERVSEWFATYHENVRRLDQPPIHPEVNNNGSYN